MDDKESTPSGSQTRPEESASESQAEPKDQLHELFTALGLTTVKTKHKNYVKFDAVKTRKFVLTKIFPRDVDMLCRVGIEVGNRFNNKRLSLQYMHPDIKIALRLLIKRLRIKPKADNGNTLTLTRVMASFPEVTVAVASKYNVPMIFPFEALQWIHADFPRIARTQVAAAIVPRTLKIEEKRFAFALMIVSSLLTSKRIRAIRLSFELSMLGINRKKEAEQALNYVLKSFKSIVLSDEERMQYALKFGVVDSDGALSPAWLAAGTASTAWLKDKYEYDISTSSDHFYESS